MWLEENGIDGLDVRGSLVIVIAEEISDSESKSALRGVGGVGNQ